MIWIHSAKKSNQAFQKNAFNIFQPFDRRWVKKFAEKKSFWKFAQKPPIVRLRLIFWVISSLDSGNYSLQSSFGDMQKFIETFSGGEELSSHPILDYNIAQ